MTREELKQKHKEEWQKHHEGYLKSWEQLHKEKFDVINAFSGITSELPKTILKMFDSSFKDWCDEWGNYGWRYMALRRSQDREIKEYMRRELQKKILGIKGTMNS